MFCLSKSTADTHGLLGENREEDRSSGRKKGGQKDRNKTNRKEESQRHQEVSLCSDGNLMKPRHLLSTVERLPTINEMQESNREDEDLEYSSHTMEEYVNSIKELSQPAPFPLHGPLRGHRRWMVRSCPTVTPGATHSTYAPWIPVELSDISLTLTDPSHCDSSPRVNQNLLDRLAAQTLFSGLV
ncbi:hypothetical protein NQZ68_014251 [Dissostichus eleginoides]|nr:hypothetical protein NQZ68_014251 [Dissostichus eleginoides]